MLQRFFMTLCLTASWELAVPAAAAELPYKGQTLRVLSFQDNHARAVASRLKEFEALTGAKVVFDAMAANMVAAKIGTDQAAGGTYDLYTVDEPFMPQLSPFFVPLAEWPASKVLPADAAAPAAFLPSAVAGTAYKSVSYGLPVNGNVYMYVYRRDLLTDPKEQQAFRAKYGYDLAAPTTTDQMRDVAAFFTRPPKLYGFAPFTKSSEGTTVEAIWVLATFGVDVFDEQLNLVLDEKKAAAAFAYYASMMQYAPPGAANWHHAERMAAYSKGQIAQIMTWPSYVKDLENPARSLVVGKSAYAAPPAAKSGRPAAVAGTWSVAIPKNAKARALAAEFAYWWASRSAGRGLVDAGMNPARRDLLSDPELVKLNPWFPGVLANFEQAVVRPRFPKYQEASAAISRHFTELVSGQASPEQAARGMKADLTALSKESKL